MDDSAPQSRTTVEREPPGDVLRGVTEAESPGQAHGGHVGGQIRATPEPADAGCAEAVSAAWLEPTGSAMSQAPAAGHAGATKYS